MVGFLLVFVVVVVYQQKSIFVDTYIDVVNLSCKFCTNAHIYDFLEIDY